ncbi:MAG: phytoene desaturase [Rhodobacteraceae bacterium]|nr:phytoene desaturase [Paracoccaceae bacterium]
MRDQRPSPDAMSRAPRVVVVGAGMGGLAAAIRLAAAGLSVTLLEAAAAPGGKARTLPTAAGPADAGPTVLTLRPVFDALFAAARARMEDHVALEEEPLLARHFWPDGSRLDLCRDHEANLRAIHAFAGAAEARGFDTFSARAARLWQAFAPPMLEAGAPDASAALRAALARPRLLADAAPLSTLAGVLARHFHDPRLRQLFGRYATYVGGSPWQAPGVLALIWAAESQGVWRVRGGMAFLAQALAGLARSLGVDIRLSCPVDEILVEGGSCVGVRAGGTAWRSDVVVFNGDPAALRRGLLGAALRGAVPAQATSPRSLSAHVWAFAARVAHPDLAHHNVFFGARPRAEFDDLRAGRVPRDPTLYVCAQDRGSGGEPPDGPERFEIIMNGAPVAGDPTDEEERLCRIRTFQTLTRHGLSFAPEPEPEALTTPGGFAALFPGSDGSLYGRSPHGVLAPFQRPRARRRVRGLYLAGGGVHPGAGVPMATLSGKHAAEAILSDLALTSRFRPTAMPGGISTASPTMAATPSRSSAS